MTDQEIIEAMVEAYDNAYEAEYLLHGARGNNYTAMCAAFAVASRAVRERCAEVAEVADVELRDAERSLADSDSAHANGRRSAAATIRNILRNSKAPANA